VPNWEVGELVGVWWRPKAENYLVLKTKRNFFFDCTNPDLSSNLWKYPYVPAHVTKPREMRKMFLIKLPEHCMFLRFSPFFFDILS